MSPARGDIIDCLVKIAKTNEVMEVTLKCGQRFHGVVKSCDDYVMIISHTWDSPPSEWYLDVHEIAAFRTSR